MLWLTILLYCILFAGIAMTVNEGLWSNTISLFCVILAALLAWYWGLVLGKFVIEQMEPDPTKEWAFWFASIWGVFFLSVMILRIMADRLSRVRMKFIPQLELAGGIVMGLGVAIMFTSFAAYSLFVPLKARVWKAEEAAGWQQQSISTLAAPIYATGKAFYGEGFPDLKG
jgi:uncharacterized membrane protein required for colicin V production